MVVCFQRTLIYSKMFSLRRFFYEQHWTLGFIEQPLSDIVQGRSYEIHYLKGMPKDRWFADPFILDYDSQEIKVLVEEFCYGIRRGRIARLTIERNSYRLKDYKIILDLSTHLSFPFIIRKKGKVYICPENSESGAWHMYEYDSSSDELTRLRTIINEPLTDAIVCNAFGESMIFSTHLPTQNGNVLSIFNEEGALVQEVQLNSNAARNAGDWFKAGDKVYRPAQDCNGAYGKAVIIQEVQRENDGSFKFIETQRIESTHPKYTTGCHTFNSYNDLIVVDVHGRRRPMLFKLFSGVMKMAGRR